MAFNDALATRIADVLSERSDIEEKRMFGGIAFMVGGHMCCGVAGDRLMLRVGPERHAEALEQPHVLPMDFTGRPMKGYVFVEPEGVATKSALKRWVGLGVEFVGTLPPRSTGRKR